MTGIDVSHTLLEEARKRSPMLPGTPTYLLRDMRDLPFFEQFEGVASLFTSFGYFDDKGADLEVLDGSRRALVPGFVNVHVIAGTAQKRTSPIPE